MLDNAVNNHPCFREDARAFARIHLPVAPKCNIACKYCVRKYDCMNENRPGVTSEVYTPDRAVEAYLQSKQKLGERLTVVGISGPGDPLANWDVVCETLEKIRQLDRDITLCLSTNGLCLQEHVEDLVRLNARFVTVTVNAFNVETASKIYHPVGGSAEWYAEFLGKQWAGIAAATKAGIECKINTVLIRGVNECDAIRIAEKAKQYGCNVQNLLPLIPLPETCFDRNNVVSPNQLCALRKEASRYIRQISHCQRCRADACGSL